MAVHTDYGESKQLLGLSAVPSGEYFRISWNPNSEPVRRATRAVLFLKDGGAQRSIGIPLEDLRIGRLLYSPASGDLQLRLEIASTDNLVARESVIALSSNQR